MKALVTGGGGFLGGAIVRVLLDRGVKVVSFSRRYYPGLEEIGVKQRQGDLADQDQVASAVEGCDTVFHVAGKPGVWGLYEEYYRTNVAGTENVISACQRHEVRRLIYTSSPSVIFDGKDMEGVDESVPYPDHYETHYPKTKAMAERMVLKANGPQLATVVLRPHLIWGPGDNHLVPRIIDSGKKGRLRQIGHGANLVDSVYIDNAAEAHVLAAERLAVGSTVAGKVYFVSQGEPLPVWELINRILAAGGLPPVTRRVPSRAARAAGWILESIYKGFRLKGEPPMTRFVARELSTAHWFDIDAARRDLGYTPQISIDEGMQRLGQYLHQT
jgi:nucleoside-diphosphate-sugar epimerase